MIGNNYNIGLSYDSVTNSLIVCYKDEITDNEDVIVYKLDDPKMYDDVGNDHDFDFVDVVDSCADFLLKQAVEEVIDARRAYRKAEEDRNPTDWACE